MSGGAEPAHRAGAGALARGSAARPPTANALLRHAVLGRSLSTCTRSYGRHVRTQDGVHARLVARSMFLEPVEHVSIDTKRDRLLRNRVYKGRVSPELSR